MPEAIAALNQAGYKMAVCTSQAEIGRGTLSGEQVRRIHDALIALLDERGATVARVFARLEIRNRP